VNKKTFDKAVKAVLKLEERKFAVILNGKNLVYPKQPRPPKKPQAVKEEFGISLVGYDFITVAGNWKELGDNSIRVRLLKEPILGESGKIVRLDSRNIDIGTNETENPRIIDWPDEVPFVQVLFELHQSKNPIREVVLDVQLKFGSLIM
jgi:hypothetical protein